MADIDPIDKGKVTGVVFDLLDHLDEWYGPGAEIGHALVVVRVTDANGARCTDVVTSPGTTKEEALGMLRRAHDIRSRPAAKGGGGTPGAAALAGEGIRWVSSDEGRRANRAGCPGPSSRSLGTCACSWQKRGCSPATWPTTAGRGWKPSSGA